MRIDIIDRMTENFRLGFGSEAWVVRKKEWGGTEASHMRYFGSLLGYVNAWDRIADLLQAGNAVDEVRKLLSSAM